MSTSKVSVCVQGGTPVWDSFDGWIKLVKSVGGNVLLVFFKGDEDMYEVFANNEPWTDESIAEAIARVAEYWDVEPEELEAEVQ